MKRILALGSMVVLVFGVSACSSEPAGTESPTADPYTQLVSSGPVAQDSVVAANPWASKIKQAGVLKVGGTQSSALFAQLNPATGEVRGFDAGISQMLSRYILGDVNTERTQITLDTRESVLEENAVDTVIATFSITPERAQRVAFAGPYFDTRTGILVSKDRTDITSVEDLAGKTVATEANSTGVAVLEKYAPEAKVLALPENADCLEAVRSGQADAYVIDEAILWNALVTNDDFKIVGEPFGPIDRYGIGVNKDSDAVGFINEFLTQIEADGSWAQLWQLTIGDPTGLTEVPAPPTVGDTGL